MSKEELQQLLVVVECLIDTVERTTCLDSVYDDSREQDCSWVEVGHSYRLLKALCNTD